MVIRSRLHLVLKMRGSMEMKMLELMFLLHLLFCLVSSKTLHHVFNVELTEYTRLCETKNILTINGIFPGPTLYAHKGDTLVVDVYNHATDNITIHWHGVKQKRNPWFDGPAYITQCPIKPGSKFSYIVNLSEEEGTIWWHAHSDWARATVHGALVIYPKPGFTYPFPKCHQEYVLILGEWWKEDVNDVLEDALQTGDSPRNSDAYTINGQPGHFYPCSKSGTFRMVVEHGGTHLLRIINVGMTNGIFLAVADHQLTVVGSDGRYTKPVTVDYIVILPGESMDVLLHANKSPNQLYYLAASPLSYQEAGDFDNTTTTAILEYTLNNSKHLTSSSSSTDHKLPSLPVYNDTVGVFNFSSRLRSLVNEHHQIDVPRSVNKRLYITVSVNRVKNNTRFSSSLNNISFTNPSTDILQAYYRHINGVFKPDFPNKPPFFFNFTADEQPETLLEPRNGTKVVVLEYGDEVEMVFQGTSLVRAESHPMHLHGFSFYVVGSGFGNFDKEKDTSGYNLVDPALKNTVGVPRNGWVAIRFKAHNPGVWFLHCHLERHMTWGMNTVVIVKNGDCPESEMLPPPPYMPPC